MGRVKGLWWHHGWHPWVKRSVWEKDASGLVSSLWDNLWVGLRVCGDIMDDIHKCLGEGCLWSSFICMGLQSSYIITLRCVSWQWSTKRKIFHSALLKTKLSSVVCMILCVCVLCVCCVCVCASVYMCTFMCVCVVCVCAYMGNLLLATNNHSSE